MGGKELTGELERFGCADVNERRMGQRMGQFFPVDIWKNVFSFQSRRNLPNFFRMSGVIERNPFSFKMRSQASTVNGFPASSRVSTNGKPESVVPKETDVFLGMGFEITDARGGDCRKCGMR